MEQGIMCRGIALRALANGFPRKTLLLNPMDLRQSPRQFDAHRI
jgi:hypothetical protein